MTDKTLKQFYREIQQWIDDGCPDHEYFSTRDGLCDNLRSWDGEHGCLIESLIGSFRKAGLYVPFPFNETGGYYRDYIKDTLYKNPARLAWIKEHAS